MVIIILSTVNDVMAVSTLLFGDGHKESEYLNSVWCVCVSGGENQGTEAKKHYLHCKKEFST